MPRRLTKAERVARIPDIEISRLKGDEGRKQLIQYVRTLQAGYKRRIASFARQGEFSHAQFSLENSFTPGAHGKISSMSMRQLHMEFARYAQFFKSETSTLEGIRKVNRQQDVRIFGVDEKTGRPLQTMTAGQREEYWKLYDEYMNQHPEHFLASEQIQRILGSAQFIPNDSNFDISKRIEEIRAELERQRNIDSTQGSVPNVFMGGGPFITG